VIALLAVDVEVIRLVPGDFTDSHRSTVLWFKMEYGWPWVLCRWNTTITSNQSYRRATHQLDAETCQTATCSYTITIPKLGANFLLKSAVHTYLYQLTSIY
jgi:hypothetical protein